MAARKSKKLNPAEIQAVSSYWWILLLEGIIAIVIGWLLLKNPVSTTISLVVVLGLYWLITGVVEVISSLFEIGSKGSYWGLKLTGGLIGVITGLFVINHPILTGVFTPIFLMYTVAFVFVINGIIHMAVGNNTRQNDQTSNYEWTWGSFFIGFLYLLIGMMLLSSPTLVATATMITIAAILTLIGGIAMIVLSFNFKSLGERSK